MTISPFWDQTFATPKNGPPQPPKPTPPSHPYHRRNGPCQAAYARGCRCPDCRQAWREGVRRRADRQPSALAIDVNFLTAELDAAEMEKDALREEVAMLRARIQELEADQ